MCLVHTAHAQSDIANLTATDGIINPLDTIKTDSTIIAEVAPLDIGQTRGLFITTPDGDMQLRILGSVRYLVVYDGLINANKNGFNTYEIPIKGNEKPIPNYFNGLDQTRIGFEITRKTSKGNVFIRLESDFAGLNGFRIRHAYGQFGNFLFGQTWSLFSHINALPATVDFASPTSNVITRTPQIRYSFKPFKKQINLQVALEYLIPNLTTSDSIKPEVVQLIPNLTFRLNKIFNWGSAQLSSIVPTLSARNSNAELIVKRGWGISGSTVINSWKKGTWYVQAVAGKGINTYFNELSGAGLDVSISPSGKVQLNTAFGFYVSYEHYWVSSIYSNLTYGWVKVDDYSSANGTTYKSGQTMRLNTFWDITEGAKVGAEIIWGAKRNHDHAYGEAFRANLLFYYDF